MTLRKRAAATRPFATRPFRRRVVGIDVDSVMTVTCFFDAEQTKAPVKEFRNDPVGRSLLAAECQRFDAELIVLESTGQFSLAVYDVLKEHSLKVAMINPQSVRAVLRSRSGGKTDRNDSYTLAMLGATMPNLQWSSVPDHWQRRVRHRFRILDEARRDYRRANNRLGAQLRQYGIDWSLFGGPYTKSRRRCARALRPGSDQLAVAEGHPQATRRAMIREHLNEVRLNADLLAYRDHCLAQLDYAEATIDRSARWLTKTAALYSDHVQWMMTVPCTDSLLALRVLSEFGRDFWERYPRVERFCAAAGVGCIQERVTVHDPGGPGPSGTTAATQTSTSHARLRPGLRRTPWTPTAGPCRRGRTSSR